jgi:hypothetical protein
VSSILYTKNRFQGDSEPNQEGMDNYFKGFIVEHIERAKNIEADELAKATTKKVCYDRMYFSKSSKIPQ